MYKEIIAFIDRFTLQGALQDTIITFTQGCCYWFSYIMHTRFPDSAVMYDPIENHFVIEIEGRLYDITGEVTNDYKVVDWNTYPDEIEKKRIIQDCINF